MLEGQETFTVIDKDGNIVECEILCTFDGEETHKSYVIYTDNTYDENGKLRVFSAIYSPNSGDRRLRPVKEEEDRKLVQSVMDNVFIVDDGKTNDD